MRFGLTLTAAMSAALLAGGVLAASPAHSASSTAFVVTTSAEQYVKSCLSASTCNQITTGELDVFFERSGSTTQPLSVFYKMINGTAINGVDFNTPATGEVTIPAGQAFAIVPVPLVNEGMFGSTKSFTAQITSTSPSITISPSTATQSILGGNVPTDCSFTFLSGTSQSLTCTGRPATQVWHLVTQCGDFRGVYGTDVTGNGTSTVTGCQVSDEAFATGS